MSVNIVNQIGKIEISDHTIATIAGLAVYECPGVAELPNKKISDGIVDFLGKENLAKGIKIHNEENRISVDVYIIVEFGVKISEIADGIISAIRKEVQNITSFEVDKVNVFVEGIKVDK